MDIKHEAQEHKGAFVAYIDGQRAGEMTYSVAGTDKIIIDHTGIEESFNGKGVGKAILLEGVIPYVRDKQLKVLPLCPFASAIFKKMTNEIGDVLV
ncbi:GNAT family N-acetyltransferase [Myroides sp. M-43]|uniref:GNAT family N-acetyltransferase n=1 Tax=Myroides oncorhynchi TaxID=2893756 RepID=UPI001E404EB4|nr:GNAT family N-acetyltransferase [Myroides oncorhynchi]MCC9044449.1 GNAT family N-acetyltransferase [Myroides oncorhynchi]